VEYLTNLATQINRTQAMAPPDAVILGKIPTHNVKLPPGLRDRYAWLWAASHVLQPRSILAPNAGRGLELFALTLGGLSDVHGQSPDDPGHHHSLTDKTIAVHGGNVENLEQLQTTFNSLFGQRLQSLDLTATANTSAITADIVYCRDVKQPDEKGYVTLLQTCADICKTGGAVVVENVNTDYQLRRALSQIRKVRDTLLLSSRAGIALLLT
jgi:hypothetical protein